MDSRRSGVLCLSSFALSGLAVLVSCASSPQANPARDKVKTPITVLMVGDSMMGGFFGKALGENLDARPDVDVERVYVISTGLSGLHPFNWTNRTEELIEKHHPDVLVAYYGANDTLAVKEKDGKNYLFNSPEYRKRYARHVHEYVKRFAPRVKRLYLLGQPATDHRSLATRYPVTNDVFREICTHFPNAFYVPTWDLTLIKGKYAPYMTDSEGKLRKMKYEDAVHPTPAGGKIMTEAALPYFLAELDLKDPVPPEDPKTKGVADRPAAAVSSNTPAIRTPALQPARTPASPAKVGAN